MPNTAVRIGSRNPLVHVDAEDDHPNRQGAMSASDEEAVVQRQVEAFNAHDLDGFCACYSDDVVVIDGDGNEIVRGMDAFRERYRRQFEGDAAAEIAGRLSAGSWVVDREIARVGGRTLEVLAAYRVRGDLIDRVQFLLDAD